MENYEHIRCLIIGSGPAGYTAAIYAARANLHPVMYCGLQTGGQLTQTTVVENFPGYPEGVDGNQMMLDFRAQAERFGTDIRDGIIVKADFGQAPYTLTTDDGHTITADTVIIATGASAKYLGLADEEKYKGEGVSACATCDGAFTAMNIGDSRIYLYRDGALIQLSTDHSVLARMIRMGQITEEEAKTHPLRHQITQHFGIRPEEMVLEPAVVQEEVQTGDVYLLCSDGLTDMVDDEEILQYLGSDLSLTEKVKQLVQRAVDAGGRDNITVVLIEAEKKRGIWTKLRNRFSRQGTGKGKEDEG